MQQACDYRLASMTPVWGYAGAAAAQCAYAPPLVTAATRDENIIDRHDPHCFNEGLGGIRMSY